MGVKKIVNAQSVGADVNEIFFGYYSAKNIHCLPPVFFLSISKVTELTIPTIVNQQGGVGKTTIVVNLAYGLGMAL